MYVYMYMQYLYEKSGLNLKDSDQGFIRRFGKKKRKREKLQLKNNLMKNNKNENKIYLITEISITENLPL